MGKSTIVTIIVSLGMVVILGVGAYFINSNKKTQNNLVKIEEKNKNSSNKVEEKNDNIENENDKVEEEKENSDLNTPNTSNDRESVPYENNNGGTPENNPSSESNPLSNNNENNNDVNNVPNNNEVTVEPNPSNQENNPIITPAPSQADDGNDNGSTGTLESPSSPPIHSNNNIEVQIEQLIYQRVNAERKAAGIQGLSYNTTMEKYARIKSTDMGEKGYFSHEDPQGKLITETMKADGVSYNAWGENIAYIQGENSNEVIATKFMDNWMNSSGHRANILSTNFTSIGIGVYKIGNTYYATQEFYR